MCQVVLNPLCLPTLIHLYHELQNHMGEDRTVQLLKERFYWPNMTTHIRNARILHHEGMIKYSRHDRKRNANFTDGKKRHFSQSIVTQKRTVKNSEQLLPTSKSNNGVLKAESLTVVFSKKK